MLNKELLMVGARKVGTLHLINGGRGARVMVQFNDGTKKEFQDSTDIVNDKVQYVEGSYQRHPSNMHGVEDRWYITDIYQDATFVFMFVHGGGAN